MNWKIDGVSIAPPLQGTQSFITGGSIISYTLNMSSYPGGAHTISMSGLTSSTRGAGTVSINVMLNNTPAPAGDTSSPSAPTGLRAAYLSQNQVQLTWNAATDNVGVTGYRVYDGGVLRVSLGNLLTFTDSVDPGTSHAYTVGAMDAAGNAIIQSAPVSYTHVAPVSTTLTPPTTLTATAASATKIVLNWNGAIASAGIRGYRLSRNGSYLTGLSNINSYEDITVSPATSYAYSIQTSDMGDNLSASSVTAAVTTPAVTAADTSAPSVPTGLTVTSYDSFTQNATLSWNPSTDNVGINLYRIYKNGAFFQGETQNSATVNVGPPGTANSFTVAACDAANNCSAQSAPLSYTAPVTTTLQITSPKTGATWLIGSAQTVTWTTNVASGNAYIYLKNAAGQLTAIHGSTPPAISSGSASVTIPATLSPSVYSLVISPETAGAFPDAESGGIGISTAYFDPIPNQTATVGREMSFVISYTGSSITASPAPSGSKILNLGDVTMNGALSSLDASYALGYASGTRTLTEAQKLLADVNGDGTVTSQDSDAILSAAIGATKLATKAIFVWTPTETGTFTVSPIVSTPGGSSFSRSVQITVSAAPVSSAGQSRNSLTASAYEAFRSTQDAGAEFSGPGLAYAWNRNLEFGSPYPEDIRALQRVLADQGVYVGEITGGFYAKTYQAVKLFQKKHGIKSTGFVGPVTRQKLNELY
ncbi:peptidoglycan-binding protein [Candidatus Kaiserbacteria bacterium]|nr:peptidoglycan-binding protein [Candidatus Kaiserbacteria bacterium]